MAKKINNNELYTISPENKAFSDRLLKNYNVFHTMKSEIGFNNGKEVDTYSSYGLLTTPEGDKVWYGEYENGDDFHIMYDGISKKYSGEQVIGNKVVNSSENLDSIPEWMQKKIDVTNSIYDSYQRKKAAELRLKQIQLGVNQYKKGSKLIKRGNKF